MVSGNLDSLFGIIGFNLITMQNRLGSSALFVALFTNFYIDKTMVKTKHNGDGYTGIAADRCIVI